MGENCHSTRKNTLGTTNTSEQEIGLLLGLLLRFLLLLEDVSIVALRVLLLLLVQIHAALLARLVDRRGPHVRRDERRARLVVHGGHQPDLLQQLLQRVVVDRLLQLRLDQRLLAQHHLLRQLRVRRQQPPVHVPAIAHVRVGRLLRRHGQHARHQRLPRGGLLEEQLHHGGQHLQLHRRRLVVEGVRQRVQQLRSVVDHAAILAHHPHHGGLRLGLVDQVHHGAHGHDHRRVLARVSTEDVANHHDRLLHHIADARLQQRQQHGDAFVHHRIHLQRAATNRPHRRAYELDVRLGGVAMPEPLNVQSLLELVQNLLDVLGRGERDEQLQLLHLHVEGIVVLAEEDLDVLRQQVRHLLDDQPQVAQRHIAQLRAVHRRQRHQRTGELVQRRLRQLLVAVLHVQQDHLHSATRHITPTHSPQHHSSVHVLKTRNCLLHDQHRLLLVLRDVRCQRIQNEDLTPLRTLVQRRQQFVHQLRLQAQHVVADGLADVAQRGDRVRHHHRTRVADHAAETLDEALLLAALGVHVVELGHADGRRLAHVRVHIVDALAQRHDQVLHDLLHTDARHCAEGERADQRVGVVTITHEGIDGQNNQLRLRSRVVDEVSTRDSLKTKAQVNELLQLQRLVVNAADHVGEEHGHIGADGHGGNDAFHGVGDFGHVQAVELLLPLAHLTLLGRIEEALVVAPNALHHLFHHVLCHVNSLVRKVTDRTDIGHGILFVMTQIGTRRMAKMGTICVSFLWIG